MARSLITPVIVLSILVVGAMMGLSSQSPRSAPAPAPSSILQPFQVNEVLPKVSLMDERGQMIALNKLNSQPLLITFWSTECGECAKELPELQQFVASHAQFSAVIINVREEAAIVKQKLQDWGVTLPSYRDSGAAFAALSGTMPSSYFIKNDRISYFFPGRINTEHLQALLTER